MKYRIKEENNGFDTLYYPQYKWLLFWHCFSIDGCMDVFFHTLEGAKDWIKKRTTKTAKDWIKKRTIKTTIRIHEI